MSSKGAGLIKTVFNTDNVVMRISEGPRLGNC